MHRVAIAQEPFDALWPAVRDLGREHFEEVEDSPGRRYQLDEALMRAADASGSLIIFSARDDDRLVGYATWNLARDPTCGGQLIAHQGAIFLLPGYPSVAAAMIAQSLEWLQSHGVEFAFLHHHLIGRGRSIGRFFCRLGARPHQHVYALNLTTNRRP